MTVRELLARIDSRELTEWAAYFEMEPWGTEVEDWRAALVTSTIANANRDPKKRAKPFEPKDFMPRRVPVEEQTPDDHTRALRSWKRVWDRRFE